MTWRWAGQRERARERARERGSASVETVILAPALLMFLTLTIYGGRVAMARQAVHAAAADAARTASIARTQSAATGTAQVSATATLAAEGLRCTALQVNLDTAGFAVAVGTPATVSATVSCTVDLSDLVAPGVPGSRQVVATVTSPLDTFRERG
ncbi:MAG: pilus assembly protein [Kineosporiaceae bacterium]|nr:pilus assembly protein [Kineosporiaceae bacterium]MBK8073972.1 pilus assembly protein [Kineosporiaceae bacterium]